MTSSTDCIHIHRNKVILIFKCEIMIFMAEKWPNISTKLQKKIMAAYSSQVVWLKVISLGHSLNG